MDSCWVACWVARSKDKEQGIKAVLDKSLGHLLGPKLGGKVKRQGARGSKAVLDQSVTRE